MKNLIVSAIAGVAMFSGAAIAEESSSFLTLGVETDTTYGIESEAFLSTTTLSAGALGLNLYTDIDFNLSDAEYDGITLGADYGFGVFGINITPYAEYSLDGDSEHVDTVFGLVVKKEISF